MNRMFFYKQQNFKSPKFVPHVYIIYILNYIIEERGFLRIEPRP